MRVDGTGSPKNSTQKLSGPRRRSLLPSLTKVRYTRLVCFLLTYFLQIHTDQLFLILYRELYYRHVYSRLQPDIDDRFHSYENSCELFNYLLSDVSRLLHSRSAQVIAFADSEDGPVSLQLPEQWLWDIVDEFIYQFQSFYVWRAKVKTKTEEELVMLADSSQVGPV